jgi:hypothetical protein
MARPIPWLPRLKEIRKTAAASVRSHYTRRDLEELFLVQSRTASRLLETMNTAELNGSHLVEREELVKFLDRIDAAGDVTAEMETMRAEKTVSRRKLRYLNQRDVDPMSLYGVPNTLKLARGRIEISFATMEELAATLVTLARVLEDDLDEFVRLYEPQQPVEDPDNSAEEVSQLFRELEEMEAQRSA